MITIASTVAASAASGEKENTAKKHIRGSSLLLLGRGFTLASGFIVQVLTVRYLSKSDYGALAYALSLVSLGSSIIGLGLNKTVTRFVPIYHEQQDYNKLFGSLIMMVGTIVSLGISLVLLVNGLSGLIGQSWIKDQQSLGLLVVMISLSPITALDSLFEGMLAIFASPRAIFFRRYILAPSLEVGVVFLFIMLGNDVRFLAIGYVAAGILGLTIYVTLLVRLLKVQGLYQHFNLGKLQMPMREIFGFTLPLLSSDLVFLLRGSLVIVMLEYFQSTIDVAAFRSVLPVARLNMVVLQSFTFLFMPLASRLFARGDEKGINNLYWQSAIWISMISFPIFIVSFSLAQPLTVLLFGTRYAQSGTILAFLSLGYFFNAALGFNQLTLRVYGKVRYIVAIDFLAMITSVGVNLALIPRYGAIGAAIGTCGTLIAHNVFTHVGLRFGTHIKLFQWRYLKVYLSIVLGALGLLLLQLMVSPTIYIGFPLAALLSVLVLVINRQELDIVQTFPELLRFSLVKRLLAMKQQFICFFRESFKLFKM